MINILSMNKGNESIIIALDNNTILGSTTLYHDGGRSCSICYLFVSPPYRLKGIGRMLVNKCCMISSNLGCHTTGLMVHKENREVEPFYIKNGFIFSYQYDNGDYLMTRRN